MKIEKRTHISIDFTSMLSIVAEAIENKLNLPRGKVLGTDLTVHPASGKGFSLSYSLYDGVNK